jgi:hypothetical protein
MRNTEYLEGVDRWFYASGNVKPAEAEIPEDIQAEIDQNRARNEQGLCFRSDCGQSLWDDHACSEHSFRATEAQQLEARALQLKKQISSIR